METNDRFYSQKLQNIKPFEFNSEVAQVFDDMVSRSVPFYDEIHRIILDLVNIHFQKGDRIYDLGCSTGSTLKLLQGFLKNEESELVGIDNSSAMLAKAREKLKDPRIQLLQEHCEDVQFQSSGIIIMNYTLQFIPTKDRPRLIKNIYNSLRPGGLFILSEKIYSGDPIIDNLLVDLYYDFKRRNGYSELEISQKREALEEVLIPKTPEQQLALLEQAGFKNREMIFRWYNFASYIGIKGHERQLLH